MTIWCTPATLLLWHDNLVSTLHRLLYSLYPQSGHSLIVAWQYCIQGLSPSLWQDAVFTAESSHSLLHSPVSTVCPHFPVVILICYPETTSFSFLPMSPVQLSSDPDSMLLRSSQVCDAWLSDTRHSANVLWLEDLPSGAYTTCWSTNHVQPCQYRNYDWTDFGYVCTKFVCHCIYAHWHM